MKERPILFSGPMVRAILDGRKTCTRRIMKPQLPTSYQFGGFTMSTHSDRFDSAGVQYRCPYGNAGDLLWVKETTIRVEEHGYLGPMYAESEDGKLAIDVGVGHDDYYPDITPEEIKFRPSIFMPKKYARIWLEITDVRVERLQDISGPEIEKEGVVKGCCNGYLCGCRGGYVKPIDGEAVDDPALEFCDLWESINGKGSWDENPWVWVVEFKRVERKAEAA